MKTEFKKITMMLMVLSMAFMLLPTISITASATFTTEVKNAAELQNALINGETDITIVTGYTVIIDGTLTINNDVTLRLDGRIFINGILYNNGVIYNNGILYNNGVIYNNIEGIIHEINGEIDNEGETIHNFGTISGNRVIIHNIDGVINNYCTGTISNAEMYGNPIVNIGHDFIVVTVGATCEEDGVITVTCSRCDYFAFEVLKKLDHVEETETVSTTCTEDGYVKVTCSVCGETLSFEVIDATGHTEVTERVAATCTEDGYVKVTCSVCGEEISNTVLPALGHNYFTVVVPATCTSDGSMFHVCLRCTDYYFEVVPDLGHDFVVVVDVVVAPTCEDDGYTIYGCSRCSETMGDVVPALGHNYVGVVVVPATCTDVGQEMRVCANDASHIEYREIPVNGDNHVGGTYEKTITEATVEAEGLMGIYCSDCDTLLDTRIIDKLPDVTKDFEFLKERAAGILRNGLSQNNLRLDGKVLTLVVDGREFVLSTNANNRNIDGEIALGDGYFLRFDIKGNGSNIKMFDIILKG